MRVSQAPRHGRSAASKREPGLAVIETVPPGYLAVAAAAVFGADGRVLMARRHADAHQGGLWEFPGGKIEAGERSVQALSRELEEEVGIQPLRCQRLLQVPYSYPERRVWLDVWRVDRYRGEPHGREAQVVQWFDLAELGRLPMPAANRPIYDALRLPQRIAITPSPLPSTTTLLRAAGRFLDSGGGAIQLRAPELEPRQLLAPARALAALCADRGALCFVNIEPAWFGETGAQALHLSGRHLNSLSHRPLAADIPISSACHDLAQLRQAEAIGVSCVLLSPVRSTCSHPLQRPIGWSGFASLCRRTRVPAYALGGMSEQDLGEALWHGGQGIAGIGGLWRG